MAEKHPAESEAYLYQELRDLRGEFRELERKLENEQRLARHRWSRFIAIALGVLGVFVSGLVVLVVQGLLGGHP